MVRCSGTSSGKARGAVMNRSDVFVTADNYISIQFRREGGASHAEVTLEGDVDILLDLAHQLLSSAQSIKERKKINRRVKRGEL